MMNPSLAHRHGKIDPPAGGALLSLGVLLLLVRAREHRLFEGERSPGIGRGLGRLSVRRPGLVVHVELLGRTARRVHLVGRVEGCEVNLEWDKGDMVPAPTSTQRIAVYESPEFT